MELTMDEIKKQVAKLTIPILCFRIWTNPTEEQIISALTTVYLAGFKKGIDAHKEEVSDCEEVKDE